jgi:hypothetical protein
MVSQPPTPDGTLPMMDCMWAVAGAESIPRDITSPYTNAMVAGVTGKLGFYRLGGGERAQPDEAPIAPEPTALKAPTGRSRAAGAGSELPPVLDPPGSPDTAILGPSSLRA